MGNFLVTGAAGFIGAALAKKLLKEGHHVVSIDNLSTGMRENVPEGIQFFEAGCEDPEVYTKLPQVDYDAVFHVAGQSSGEISFDDPTYDLACNVESTLRLLKFCLERHCQRFVYASTMSVYGKKPDCPIKETELAVPESFYGVGKLASEHHLRIYEQYGIRSTCLRLFNVYGPGQNMGNLRQGMVSIFMAQMLQGGHIHIKGSRDRYRDFVYKDDVVDAFMACLSCQRSYGKILNIGTGIRTTVGELIEMLLQGYPKEVTCEYSGSTSGDIHGICADNTSARECLGFSPRVDLRTGLARMLAWVDNGS